MAEPHVITAHVRRPAELSGDIETAKKKIQQMMVDLEVSYGNNRVFANSAKAPPPTPIGNASSERGQE